MATEPKNMRTGYDYPHRLLFREKMKECSDLKDSTAKNFETAVVNPKGVYFVKAQALWTKLMPSVPLPAPLARKEPTVTKAQELKEMGKPLTQAQGIGTLFAAPLPSSKPVKPPRKHTLTQKMLKGWLNNVFTEAETLEFLADIWLEEEIS